MLEGVAAAVVGLIAVTAAQLVRELLFDADRRLGAAAIVLAALAVVYQWKTKLASPLILLAAGAAGVLAF